MPAASVLEEQRSGGELVDPREFDVGFEVNSEQMSFCGRAFTFRPGDFLSTGVSDSDADREPPVLLEGGNEVTIGIGGIGEVTNVRSENSRGTF